MSSHCNRTRARRLQLIEKIADRPALHYDFRQVTAAVINDCALVGPLLGHTRASSGCVTDELGILVQKSNDLARFDHDGGDSANVALGLLHEQARTNTCLQSEDLTTTWTIPGANTTITVNQGVAPDGNTTMDDVLHDDSAETIQQTIELHIRCSNLSGDLIQTELNGETLGVENRQGQTITYQLMPSYVIQGHNDVLIRLMAGGVTIEGVELHVNY